MIWTDNALSALQSDQFRIPASFEFDLGAELEICPSKDATDDQWSLHNWNGKIIAYRNDGVIVFEPPS